MSTVAIRPSEEDGRRMQAQSRSTFLRHELLDHAMEDASVVVSLQAKLKPMQQVKKADSSSQSL
jgi:hypothetical protein